MSVKGKGNQHLYESQYFYLCVSLNAQMKSWKQSNWERTEFSKEEAVCRLLNL